MVLVDNVIDLHAPPRGDTQPALKWVKTRASPAKRMLAGHGLSLLVITHVGDESHQVLYDTGPSPLVIENNTAALGLHLDEVEAIVLSHGHWDHSGGLLWSLKRIGKQNTPVYLHPDMFRRRGTLRADSASGKVREFDPVPSPEEIRDAGGLPILQKEPTLLAKETLLIGGVIPRVTKYETGTFGHMVYVKGTWREEMQLLDDSCLLANVRGRGLVVMSGCSHSGIVNIMKHARGLTGEDRIAAIVAGLHLTGDRYEGRVAPTVDEIVAAHPDLLVVTHCTGRLAQRSLESALPESFVPCSVGHRFTITSDCTCTWEARFEVK